MTIINIGRKFKITYIIFFKIFYSISFISIIEVIGTLLELKKKSTSLLISSSKLNLLLYKKSDNDKNK